MDKYYTPKPEELHVGLEIKRQSDGIWYKTILTKYDFSPNRIYGDLFKKLERDEIKIKYLDKEDIESFKFELSATYGDYIEFNDNLKSFNPKSNKVLYNIKSKNIDIEWFAFENESTNILFNGYIKNKFELKKLLIQLRILND